MSVKQVVERLTQETVNEFFSKYRDHIACIKQTPAEIEERTTASAMLDRSTREELTSLMEVVDQAHPYARQVGQEDFKKALAAAMARSYLKCLHNGSLTYACKATEEADQQYQLLKYAANLEKAPAPPAPPKSAAEILDDQIRDDWAHLPADKIKAKQNDLKYKKRLEELLNSDAIKSQATTLHDIVGG